MITSLFAFYIYACSIKITMEKCMQFTSEDKVIIRNLTSDECDNLSQTVNGLILKNKKIYYKYFCKSDPAEDINSIE